MNGEKLTLAFKRLRNRLRLPGESDDDCADALQEAFCRLWTCRERLRNDAEADGIMATAARNIAIDTLRRRHAYPASDICEIGDNAGEESAEETEATYRRVERLSQEVLSERDRRILFLRERDGWEFDELADHFGLSEANVRMIVSRARKALREIYRQQKFNEV